MGHSNMIYPNQTRWNTHYEGWLRLRQYRNSITIIGKRYNDGAFIWLDQQRLELEDAIDLLQPYAIFTDRLQRDEATLIDVCESFCNLYHRTADYDARSKSAAFKKMKLKATIGAFIFKTQLFDQSATFSPNVCKEVSFTRIVIRIAFVR